MRIRQLPASIANQIAAGEVIECPASVVKELLENAADANATAINIVIGFGGLNQIKVSDNGEGIVAEDLPLAVAAHATSKINCLADLYTIGSLGFRGEALASMAAISRLTLSSKPHSQACAMQLTTKADKIEIIPCARSQGTTVEILDLFYNVPVRKKFLKSERSEFQKILALVKQFAMSRPTIAIDLTHNGTQQLHLPAANNEKERHQRMARLLGKDFAAKALAIAVEHAGIKLIGWLGNGDYQRNQNDKQWVYINGRMVKDKLLNHAIKQAYEAVLLPGKHPACLLYLTINSADVDVNVHPTKHEVRFQQPRLIHDFIVTQLTQALKLTAPAFPSSSQAVREWQLCEANPVPLLLAANKHKALLDDKMIRVDERFMIFATAGEIYLADVKALQATWLRERLLQQTLPLANRPLLVTIRHSCPTAIDEAACKHYTALLEQIGIVIKWANTREFMVCSLPVIAPYVNIKALLTALFALPETPDLETVVQLLVDNQTTSTALSNQEQSAFKEYLLNKSGHSEYYKQLTASLCRELIDV